MSFFNNNQPNQQPQNIFGGAQNTQTNTTTPQGLFGGANPTGGLFGNTGTTATPSGGGLFGGGGATGTSAGGGLFGGSTNVSATNASTPAGTTTTPAAPSLFGGVAATGAAPNTTAAKPTSSFFSQPAVATSSTTTPTLSGSFFSMPPKPAESAQASTTPIAGTSTATSGAPQTTPSLFGGGIFGKPATPTSTSPGLGAKDATTLPASNPLGGLFSKPAENKETLTASTTPSLGLFGAPKPDEKKDDKKPEEKKDGTAAFPAFGLGLGKPPAKEAEKPSTGAATGQAAASTTPAVSVPLPSVLRGKSIEEIVNTWSNELEAHVKDFNKFASDVSLWDRALIENGNNLAILYSHVLAAEREQSDIDQSLDHVEQQQKDLSATLDAYEKITQEVLGNQLGSARIVDTGPADTERDKNYMLATDLHTHLDDLSGSLTQMVDSVNSLSAPASGTTDQTSGDDPMGQIAQILTSHLESLQWIDGAVREVETKVTDVEKRVRGASGQQVVQSNTQKTRGFGLNR